MKSDSGLAARGIVAKAAAAANGNGAAGEREEQATGGGDEGAEEAEEETSKSSKKNEEERGAGVITNDRWLQFQTRWVSKHGSAAAKEMEIDRQRRSRDAGLTTHNPNPSPFRVVHLKGGAPIHESSVRFT